MSRKHFIALAEAIAQITNEAERKRTAELVASVCAQSNSDFNRSRFMSACHVQ